MDIKLIQEDLGGAASFFRGEPGHLEVQKVRLLDRQQVLERGVLYLGDLTKAWALSQEWRAEKGCALLLAEAPQAQVSALPAEMLPEVTLISRLSIPALFNRVSALLEAPQEDPLHAWKLVLSRAGGTMVPGGQSHPRRRGDRRAAPPPGAAVRLPATGGDEGVP